MYIYLKDNKIMAASEEYQDYSEFGWECEETDEEIVQVEGQLYKKSEEPEIVYTKEQIEQFRASEYQNFVDPITSHIQRLRDEEQTEEILTKIDQLIIEREQKVKEIKEKYPYPTTTGTIL